jgi:hypothetical protein
MNKQYSLDKYHNILFRELDESILTVDEKKILIRYRAVFTLSLETPWVTDVELRDYLVSEFGISIPQAYKDLTNVRVLLGSVQNAGKEWIRYMVNETLKKAIDDARKLGKSGIKLMIMAADTLGKYNRLDKEDSLEIPWDDIIPQSIEPTSDPTVLGIKPLENKEEAIRKMYEKYKDEIEIEDVDYEPVEK